MQYASPSPIVLPTPVRLIAHDGNNYDSKSSFVAYIDAPLDEENPPIDDGDIEGESTNQNNDSPVDGSSDRWR